MLEIVEDIVDVFDADRESNIIRGYASCRLLSGRQLLMSSAGGMDSERLRVAQVGQMGRKFQAVDETTTRLEAPIDPETDDVF